MAEAEYPLSAMLPRSDAGANPAVFSPPLKEGKISWLSSLAQLRVRAACALLLSIAIHGHPAFAEVPGGTWLFANRVAVQIFECSGLLCGRIVWLLRPASAAGQPDLDYLNPDPVLRQRRLCGLTIIWGMHPNGPGRWSNGWLYDPKDGATYDVTAKLTAPNTISARVYHGVPLLGRTEILTRDPPLSFDGRC
jgi:uncharacterized protein (DUF2147 family)